MVIDQVNRGGDDLTKVVRRDIRSQSNGDAGRAVDEQVWELGWQDRGLLSGIVERRAHVDGLLPQFIHEAFANGSQFRLGVPFSGWRIAVNRTEVALAVDQWRSHHEVLSQPD